MRIRNIGSLLLFLMGLNAFLDSFFSFERGNFPTRTIPYIFKLSQMGLMFIVIIYFLNQRSIRIKMDPLFWALFLFAGDMALSVLYAPDSINPTDLARMLFWVTAGYAVYLLRQADCLDEKMLLRMILFNFFWVCFRILAYKVLHLWIGAEPNESGIGGFDKDGVVNNLGYSLVWFVPLFMLFDSKIKFPVLLMVFFSMVASFKRGALVGLIVGFPIYYFLNRRVQPGKPGTLTRDMVRFAIVLGLAGLGFLVFKEHILTRMDDVGGNKSFGSGRGEIYSVVLKHFERLDGMRKVIGAGFFEAVPMLGRYSEREITAHSDWLETLYDQGFIGVGIMALIHCLFIIRLLREYLKKSVYGPSLAYSYIIFFLANIYSIVLYTFDSTWFGVSLGYYLGTGVLLGRKRELAPEAKPAGRLPGGYSAGALSHE